ncbi:unnamed protein product [Rotaria magnacalcarata]|uniref:Uncharacterized protein n=1 Tax=Rotaria magnacalcarata TaxID=392030 RepID=A0A816XH03_9BILA|nr:unnamed protein product [Rotaria magnacalcarata]
MNRKKFIKNSLLASGTFLLPNAIWAFNKNYNVGTKDQNKFVSKPNLKRFKVSEIGTKFFETELSILKSQANLQLHRKYFISENINGICTPTLLETNNKENLVFIPELYKDKKHNGFIVKVCENGLCEETKIFTHENQGYYAFWGKEYLGHPTLYHYNVETFHLMRMHKENGQWINHRVMPMYPNEMLALYKQQLQEVKQEQLTQQFGYDFEIHKDGFYQFLALKNDWEQGIITKEKEAYEKQNPATIYTPTNAVQPLQTGEPTFTYTNPFVPIYCKGDDLSHATIKPTIIYEEVAGTKIEIADMPAYKTQDELGDCRAFSLATLLQHYTCQKWKSDIPDCKNPPSDSAISYFGLMAYTNRAIYKGGNLQELKSKGFTEEELEESGISKTFQPNQDEARSMYVIINELSKSGNRLIMENCKPFENLATSFSTSGAVGLAKRDELLNYLKSIFERLKNKSELNIKDCSQEVAKLNSYVDLKFNQITLKKALIESSLDHFLYVLFFSECKMENFPSGFRALCYPLDDMDIRVDDVKNIIIKGLKLSKPVMLPSLCLSEDKNDECKMRHALVISGYKKVKKSTLTIEVFKVHNSWGIEWQKKHNDGWMDADAICHNTSKIKSKDGSYRIGSASVIWLD